MAKHLIVGGVAAGMSAATRLRRLDESAEIIVFERGDYVSYANCGLPYYIGDAITERERLLVQTPRHSGTCFNIEVRTGNEVIAVLPGNKSLRVKDSNQVANTTKITTNSSSRPVDLPLSRRSPVPTTRDTYPLDDPRLGQDPRNGRWRQG
jgi:NADPH-dependent 2,4-dienoyl-CoA reductase/sulfur reductase-like enzyme